MISSTFNFSSTAIWKTLAFSTLIIIVLVIFSNQPNSLQTDIIHVATNQSFLPLNTTNVSHLVFGLVGSTKAWRYRKPYIESWWRPNTTRGYLYLDRTPTDDLLPWSQYSPPFRISDDNSKLLEETKHVAPIMVRMVHAVIEVFREEREGVRWYVMGDDDSIFFVDNLVDELSKYDHTKYIYIGGHSESIISNQIYSYDMGFGGAGLILSYPLAKMVQQNIEDCFRRYPYLNSADLILMTCVNDFGVSVTPHQGLHQKTSNLKTVVRVLGGTRPSASNIFTLYFNLLQQSADVKKQTHFLLHVASVWSTSSATEGCRSGPQTSSIFASKKQTTIKWRFLNEPNYKWVKVIEGIYRSNGGFNLIITQRYYSLCLAIILSCNDFVNMGLNLEDAIPRKVEHGIFPAFGRLNGPKVYFSNHNFIGYKFWRSIQIVM